nr:hypothetical protein [Tanacetum cinerariifolium]
MRDKNPIRTLGDYSKPSNKGYKNTIELYVGNNVLRNQNTKVSWALLEDLALYDNESWNDPRDFAKSIKAITFPQDVSSTSDHCLIELETQVQHLMEAHLSPMQLSQVNKVTTSCEISSGPYDTQYCMEDPEQAFVEYASSCTNERGSRLFTMNQGPRSFNEAENEAKGKGSVEPNKTEYTKRKNENETNEEVKSEKEVMEETKGETEEEEEEDDPKHFDTFPTMKELSVINHYLGLVVFKNPFIKATRLVYNKEEGMVMFKRDKERIIFKMPYKIDMFKHVDFTDRGTDIIPPFIIGSDDDNCEKTYYSDNLDLGPEYKYDEYVYRGIRSLMAAKARRKNKGEVT